jgi:hypothetical protein
MKTKDLLLIIMGSLFGVAIGVFIIYKYRKDIAIAAGNGYEWVTGEKKEKEATEIRKKIKDDLDDLTVQVEKLKIKIFSAGEKANQIEEGIPELRTIDQSHNEHMIQLDQLRNDTKDLNDKIKNLLKENAEMFPDLPRTDEERARRAIEHEEEIEIIEKQTERTRAIGIIFKTGTELSRANAEHSDVVAHFTNISNIGKYTPEQINANFDNANAKVAEAEKKCEEATQNHSRISLELELLLALQNERKNKLKDGVQSERIVLENDGGSQKQIEQGNVVS